MFLFTYLFMGRDDPSEMNSSLKVRNLKKCEKKNLVCLEIRGKKTPSLIFVVVVVVAFL